MVPEAVDKSEKSLFSPCSNNCPANQLRCSVQLDFHFKAQLAKILLPLSSRCKKPSQQFKADSTWKEG